MFCPSCGTEESYNTQFCRACGSNLKIVRSILEKPDSITASAAQARDEIGRAFAMKISEMKTAKDLNRVAEEGLPYIEKFLESPEERRLRRIRTGSLVAFIGFGVTIALSIVSVFTGKNDMIFMAGAGLITFFIGISFVINGLLFSVPKKVITDKSSEGETQRQLEFEGLSTSELKLPESNQIFTSVIDETTQHLKEKQPVSRK